MGWNMKHAMVTIFLLSFLLIQCRATAETAADQNSRSNSLPDMTEKTEKVDEIFADWDRKDYPGCAVAVSRDGHQFFSRAYGMADLEHSVPNTPSTIFEAGSVSKQFVSAAVVLLKLEGKLSLDDDIRDYLPEVPDYGETITIRHLLTHTSGLRDWGSVAAISGWGRSARTHNHDHTLDIISRQTRLNFSPGDFYSYSNSGYNLAVMIIEEIIDGSFAEYSKEHIFKPLGMNNTQWRDDYRRIVEGRSSAYTAISSDSVRINRPIEHIHGNGGLLTTVGDLNIWNETMQTGRLAGEDFVEIMHEMPQLNNGRTSHYALAIREGTHQGLHYYSHTGATSGYRAFLRRYPEQHTSVVILCNVTNASPGALGNQVSEVFLADEAVETDDPEPEGITLSHADLEERAGIYKNPLNGSVTRLEVEDDTLKTANGSVLTPKSSQKFRVGTADRHYVFNDEGDIQILVEDYEEGVLKSVEEFEPSEDELTDFEGTYYSKDAETEFTIEAGIGKLILHRRPGNTFEVEPAYTDAFTGGIGTLRFHRNDAGEVEQLSLGRGRVYDMRFDRRE